MAENEREALPAPPRRRASKTKLLLTTLVILFLAGVIVYLLSDIHSKTFYLVAEGDQLVVKKGAFFPWGSAPYQPAELDQAALYAALPLPAGSGATFKNQSFADLPSLNHELGGIMIEMSQQQLSRYAGASNPAEGDFQNSKALLERVKRLKGLDAKQLDQVMALGADLEYVEGKRAYLGVEEALKTALGKFRKAESFGTGRFKDAGEWILKIQNLLEAIRITKAGVLPEAPAGSGQNGAVAPTPESAGPNPKAPQKAEAQTPAAAPVSAPSTKDTKAPDSAQR